MDRILIILKTNGPSASSAPAVGLNNMFIGICSRSQVSVYRTIGPLVTFPNAKILEFFVEKIVKTSTC